MKKLNAIFMLLALVGTLVQSHDAISQQTLENNIDRPGSDYNNFNMRANNPELCKQACFADTRCKAWTFVKPNTIQGPKPRCWLKNAVPNAVNNNCCVSGVIKISPPPPPPPDGDGCDPPICCKKPSLPQCNP
jgi:hypothetical protein